MVKKNNTVSFKAPSEKDKIEMKKQLKRLDKGKGTYSNYEIMQAGILAKSKPAEKIVEEHKDGSKSTYFVYPENQLHYKKLKAINERNELITRIVELNDEILKYNRLLIDSHNIDIDLNKDVIKIFDEDGNEFKIK